MISNNIKAEDIAAYFDFDGTLSSKDTLFSFLVYCVGWGEFILNLPKILPNLILYLLGIINNEMVKERILIILFKGKSFTALDKKAKSFAYGYISKFIKPEVFAKLEYHKEHGHKVILISANLAIYLKYWAARHKIDGVIATEIEFIDNIATGALATPNCYAKEKVKRLEQYLKQEGLKFSYSYGYGNSRGDFELLDYVNEGYLVNGIEFQEWKK
ncbi:MAG: family hydrolase [Burkholderiales bacterium]|jgi:HAD superfamily hydrolase (TIGR01490 family)|nr:family hydrolase [Burkholderiales bacterium]